MLGLTKFSKEIHINIVNSNNRHYMTNVFDGYLTKL